LKYSGVNSASPKQSPRAKLCAKDKEREEDEARLAEGRAPLVSDFTLLNP